MTPEEERLAKLEERVKNFKMVSSGSNQVQGGFPELKPKDSIEERLKPLEDLHDNFRITGGSRVSVQGSFKDGFAICAVCPGDGGAPGSNAGPIPIGVPPSPACPDVSIKVSWQTGTLLLDCICSSTLCWLTDGSGFAGNVCYDVTCSLDDTIVIPDNVLKCFPGGDPVIVPVTLRIIYNNTGGTSYTYSVEVSAANSCCAYSHTTGTLGNTGDLSTIMSFGFSVGVIQLQISFSGSLC